MHVVRIARISMALSLVLVTVTPAAIAGFPPTPDANPTCEREAAERQANHTQDLASDGDVEGYVDDTTENLAWRYVACEFFPI